MINNRLRKIRAVDCLHLIDISRQLTADEDRVHVIMFVLYCKDNTIDWLSGGLEEDSAFPKSDFLKDLVSVQSASMN